MNLSKIAAKAFAAIVCSFAMAATEARAQELDETSTPSVQTGLTINLDQEAEAPAEVLLPEPKELNVYHLQINKTQSVYLRAVPAHMQDSLQMAFEKALPATVVGEELKAMIASEIVATNDFINFLHAQRSSIDGYLNAHYKREEGYKEVLAFAKKHSAQTKLLIEKLELLKKASVYFDSEAPLYRMRAHLQTITVDDKYTEKHGNGAKASNLILPRADYRSEFCDYAAVMMHLLSYGKATMETSTDRQGNIYRIFQESRRTPGASLGERFGLDGSYYQGYFNAKMQREGNGFSIDQDWVRCGDWEADKYTGQILTHHPGRIYGIDISRYNHDMKNTIKVQVKTVTPEGNDTIITKTTKTVNIDWSDLRITALGPYSPKVDGAVNYPVDFVFIKCSEGMDLLSKYYNADLDSCLSRGIRVAPYHFYSCKSRAIDQATNFIQHGRINEATMRPMLDVEPEAPQLKQMGGIEGCLAGMAVFVDEVERATGRKCVLYLNQNFVRNYYHLFPETLKECDIWIAKYHEKHPYSKHCMWQFSSRGRVNGIYGDVDLDVFYGNREDFIKWCEAE